MSRLAGGILVAALGLASLAPLGCQSVGHAIEAPVPAPPLAEMALPPSFLTPRSQHYRLAVREFVDQTGKASGLAHSTGQVLITALGAGNRFELYDLRAEGVPAARRS